MDKSLLAILIVLILPAFVGCMNDDFSPIVEPNLAEDRLDGEIPLTSGRTLIAENIIGPIIINGEGLGNVVRWFMNRQVMGEDPVTTLSSQLPNIKLITDQSSESLKCEIHYPRDMSRFRYATLLSLGVPYNIACRINRVDGDLNVLDLGSNLWIQNAHMVKTLRINGSCEIGSLSSDQMVLPVGGFCKVSANGTITLRIPSTTSASLFAQTTSGSVSYTNLAISNINQQQRSLKGKLGDGSGEIRLETARGDIIIDGI